MDGFARELRESMDAIAAAREELLGAVRTLGPAELEATRRGGWSVREVLRHVIDSEVAYAKVVGFLRSAPVELATAGDDDVATGAAAADALVRVRARLLDAVAGVDEATFYDLRPLGREQYSVLSVLENIASHDHEHREQLRKTLGR
jgi:uncharacterized damage-inducible protein DinB